MKTKWCKHYNGLHRKTHCRADVEYAAVTLPGEGMVLDRMPCLGRCHEATCEKREFPTAEEIAEEEAFIAAMFSRTNGAIEAIRKHSGGKRGVGGEMDCPCCEGGTLHYSVASCNGHIHARCTTEDCVAFMQ